MKRTVIEGFPARNLRSLLQSYSNIRSRKLKHLPGINRRCKNILIPQMKFSQFRVKLDNCVSDDIFWDERTNHSALYRTNYISR